MKKVFFENIYNKEKFYCHNLNDIRTIDGIEYIRVFRNGTQRDVLVRKDSLKKVTNK